MKSKTFSKPLSSNDIGATGGHQAGIHIPKSNTELLEFLPYLDPKIKNPSTWIECQDEFGSVMKFRFVYYNNRLHDINGTRNEYRITHMTKYFREIGAKTGEILEISKDQNDSRYAIRIAREESELTAPENHKPIRIKISSGWRRIH